MVVLNKLFTEYLGPALALKRPEYLGLLGEAKQDNVVSQSNQ